MPAQPNAGPVVTFIKDPGPRYRSHLYRADGVVVELLGGGYNKVGGPAERVPHDLAHLIVEDEFEMRSGLWGTLAAGGLFAPTNTRVIAGRQPPHAARKAREIVKQADEELKRAEIVVRAVADLALAGRFTDIAAFNLALGERWALDGATPERLSAACERLRAGAQEWARLAEGDDLTLSLGRVGRT